MALTALVDLLAQRIAQEINAVRSEMSSISTNINIDGGGPGTMFPAASAIALDGGGV